MSFYRGKPGQASIIPVLLLVFSWVPSSFCVDYTTLENHGIHTFQNRHDTGFLTAINLKTTKAPVVTDVWRDMASQKWRVVKALLSTSYQLRPVSNEQKLVQFSPSERMVYQDDTGLGLWDSEYWQMLYVGHGYHLIKNYKNGECLESNGLGEPVRVMRCNSIPRQQWAIHAL